MYPEPVESLDASATLAHATETIERRRSAEVDDLRVVAHWAVLHGEVSDEEAIRDLHGGGDRLILLGGAGTPKVRDLPLAELAIARRTHVYAVRSVTADVLDLQFRLPDLWRQVMAGQGEVWVARRVAAMTRHLSQEACVVVDTAVARMFGTESTGRILTVAEAKVVEADPDAHAAKLDAARRRKFVTLSRATEDGLRMVVARVTAGDAAWVDATVDRVADLITPQYSEDVTRDEIRGDALGFLARPAELLAMLVAANAAEADDSAPDREDNAATSTAPEEEPGFPDPEEEPRESRATAFPADLLNALRAWDARQLRPKATLYVHLHEDAVRGAAGVARVEGLGPMLREELAELLRHSHVTVKPVIDLTERTSFNAYEIPESVRERTLLSCPGEYFPYATTMTRHYDFDHVTPYDEHGPPGQTGTHNTGPLTRHRHRVKTHGGYTVRQSGPGEYLWRTPHGRYYLVDHTGTIEIPDTIGDAVFDIRRVRDLVASN